MCVEGGMVHRAVPTKLCAFRVAHRKVATTVTLCRSANNVARQHWHLRQMDQENAQLVHQIADYAVYLTNVMTVLVDMFSRMEHAKHAM